LRDGYNVASTTLNRKPGAENVVKVLQNAESFWVRPTSVAVVRRREIMVALPAKYAHA
jgi:hypothetical protein